MLYPHPRRHPLWIAASAALAIVLAIAVASPTPIRAQDEPRDTAEDVDDAADTAEDADLSAAVEDVLARWQQAVAESDGAAWLDTVSAATREFFEMQLRSIQAELEGLTPEMLDRAVPGWGERTYSSILDMTVAAFVTVYLETLAEEKRDAAAAIEGLDTVTRDPRNRNRATFTIVGEVDEPPTVAVREEAEWRLDLIASLVPRSDDNGDGND